MQIEITPEYLASQGLSANFPQRFWAKVDKGPHPNGCWLWTGTRNNTGKNANSPGAWHGIVWRGFSHKTEFPHLIRAHVASYILSVGPLTDGKPFVLHKCPIKHCAWCVNPEHLYAGDYKDNRRDGTLQRTQAVLTPDIVRQIRKRCESGETQTALADEFGVQQPAIYKLVTRLTWAFVK